METYALNRTAKSKYEVLERLEAGLQLKGFEVKAVRAGKMSLTGAYVAVRDNEAFLIGATIAPYQANNTPSDYEPLRARKLLLHQAEIIQLLDTEQTKGLTIVPLAVYSKKGQIKLEIGLARGWKKYDHRQVIKKRETEREMRRTLKNN